MLSRSEFVEVNELFKQNVTIACQILSRITASGQYSRNGSIVRYRTVQGPREGSLLQGEDETKSDSVTLKNLLN